MMRPVNRNTFLPFALLAAGFAAAIPCWAQPRPITAADYARAEKFLAGGVNGTILHASVTANWLPDDRMWYRNTNADGSEFILVDPARKTREPAFDHAKLAAALSKATGSKYDGARMPFETFTLSPDSQSISVIVGSGHWMCDRQGNACAKDSAPVTADAGGGGGGRRGGGRGGRGGGGGGGRGGRGGEPGMGASAPDGKGSVTIRDNNLWYRETGGKEVQLTTDGVKDFGYATDNAGWTSSENPVLLWSPDSKKIATFQQDQRGVGEMYLVSTAVGHPTLRTFKYPLPGDPVITTIQRVIIDVANAKVIRLQMPPDQHRSTLCDDIKCRGGGIDMQWNADGTQLAFVSTTRDHKGEELMIADAATGAVHKVIEEKVATFFESGNDHINWRYMPASNELIWFSERDNWGQLYLYDLNGKLKNQITTGEGNVTQVTKVDEQARVIYFYGVGKEKGRDPYFVHFYSVGFDGKNQKLLTPDDGNHAVALSPSGKYFIDTYSQPNVHPAIAMRDINGNLVANLEKADISKLTATGWKPPEPIKVSCREGSNEICYGLMFKPTNLDPTKKYPIINHIYPGPQTGSVGSRNFSAARGDCQALAELGFIVVEIDGMGTPWRSKKFHEKYFGDMGDNTLPDQVAGMKDLAKRYSWIDIDRVGIYGHSGGGYATAGAMFHYPDFFKVGISESGNHDNRDYEDDWAEKWQGLVEKTPDGKSNYDSQANQNFAKNLKGHLMLAHGTADNNVPINNTLLVVAELIKANKDFDLVLFPNRPHGYGQPDSNYMMRKRWDYFVRWLLGTEPPKEFEFRAGGGAGG